MSNKKQTAVEWLVNELEEHYVFYDIKNTIVFDQAKAMEKEQIIKFVNDYLDDDADLTAEEYYKDKFA